MSTEIIARFAAEVISERRIARDDAAAGLPAAGDDDILDAAAAQAALSIPDMDEAAIRDALAMRAALIEALD